MIDEILSRTDDILATARLGLDDMLSTDYTRRMSGLRNLIVFGRSVTFTLQNLSSKADGFDEWYLAEQEVMKADSLMKYFLNLRNEILKQGKLNVSTSAYFNSFSSEDIKKFPRPRNAMGFFLVDEIGGAGWVVELPDGSQEKYYVTLPSSVGTIKQTFADMPREKFPDLDGRSVEDLSSEYLEKLSALVGRAKIRFGTNVRPSGRPHLTLVK
ncbi:hypothetical protein [Janthinobacterium tructae]